MNEEFLRNYKFDRPIHQLTLVEAYENYPDVFQENEFLILAAATSHGYLDDDIKKFHEEVVLTNWDELPLEARICFLFNYDYEINDPSIAIDAINLLKGAKLIEDYPISICLLKFYHTMIFQQKEQKIDCYSAGYLTYTFKSLDVAERKKLLKRSSSHDTLPLFNQWNECDIIGRWIVENFETFTNQEKMDVIRGIGDKDIFFCEELFDTEIYELLIQKDLKLKWYEMYSAPYVPASRKAYEYLVKRIMYTDGSSKLVNKKLMNVNPELLRFVPGVDIDDVRNLFSS